MSAAMSNKINEKPLESMTSEEYVLTLLAWDYSDGTGTGTYEKEKDFKEFRLCLLDHLQAAPANHPMIPAMKRKIHEVEQILQMSNELVEKMSLVIEEDMKADRKADRKKAALKKKKKGKKGKK